MEMPDATVNQSTQISTEDELLEEFTIKEEGIDEYFSDVPIEYQCITDDLLTVDRKPIKSLPEDEQDEIKNLTGCSYTKPPTEETSCYNCTICGSKLKHRRSFDRHMLGHKLKGDIPSQPYVNGQKVAFQCQMCGYYCTTAKKFDQHIANHRKKHSNVCEICGTVLSTEKSFHSHMYRHKVKKDINSKGEIVNVPGKEPILHCQLCEYSCTTSDKLDEHKNQCNLKCGICSYVTHATDNLKFHMHRHTKGNRYKCDMCSFETPWSTTLRNHVRSHTKDRCFECTHCNFKATRRNVLRNHIRRHTGERPYACTCCSYRASRRFTLVSHMKRIHKKAPPK